MPTRIFELFICAVIDTSVEECLYTGRKICLFYDFELPLDYTCLRDKVYSGCNVLLKLYTLYNTCLRTASDRLMRSCAV